MKARELRKAIIEYLGRDPGEDVRLKASRKSAEIDFWDVSEKQPTLEKLQTIWNTIKDREAQKEQQLIINAESRQYLRETDWYVIREVDPGDGTPVPEDIVKKRQEMRVKIVDSV